MTTHDPNTDYRTAIALATNMLYANPNALETYGDVSALDIDAAWPDDPMPIVSALHASTMLNVMLASEIVANRTGREPDRDQVIKCLSDLDARLDRNR